MKKILALLITALLLITMLASCSSKSAGYNSSTADMQGAEAPMPAPSAAPAADMDEGSFSASSTAGSGVAGTVSTQSGFNGPLSEKIIYSFSAEIETMKFDETIDHVYVLLEKYGAFIETSYVSGRNYDDSFYGYTSYRSAEFTLRVPVANFKTMTGSLAELGNVTYESTNAQNITAQFMDSEARLKTLETEESRLLTMLQKAETVEDMITIETRLSEVRYQIESLTSTLKNWQNQVDYSTVTVRITEVAELTEQVPVQRTYWEEITDGLGDTFEGIGDFFKGLFKGIVIFLPVLVILAVIAIVVIIIVKTVSKKNKKRYEANRQMNNPQYGPMNGPMNGPQNGPNGPFEDPNGPQNRQ